MPAVHHHGSGLLRAQVVGSRQHPGEGNVDGTRHVTRAELAGRSDVENNGGITPADAAKQCGRRNSVGGVEDHDVEHTNSSARARCRHARARTSESTR